jgi:hypothetical protein
MMAAAVLVVGLAGPARADVTLTLDSTDPTFVIPTQGTQTFEIDGTLSLSAPDTAITGLAVFSEPTMGTPGGTFTLSTAKDPSISFPLTGTYNGPILDVTVSATDPVGTYYFGWIAAFGNGGAQPNAHFSVTLENQTATVPEPSTALAAVFGAVAFVAYGWSRHRRAQRRPAAA